MNPPDKPIQLEKLNKMKNTLKELLENDIEKYQSDVKKDVKKGEQRLSIAIGLFFVAMIALIYMSVQCVKDKNKIELMKGKHYSDSLAIKSIEDNQRMGVEIIKFNELNK